MKKILTLGRLVGLFLTFSLIPQAGQANAAQRCDDQLVAGPFQEVSKTVATALWNASRAYVEGPSEDRADALLDAALAASKPNEVLPIHVLPWAFDAFVALNNATIASSGDIDFSILSTQKILGKVLGKNLILGFDIPDRPLLHNFVSRVFVPSQAMSLVVRHLYELHVQRPETLKPYTQQIRNGIRQMLAANLSVSFEVKRNLLLFLRSFGMETAEEMVGQWVAIYESTMIGGSVVITYLNQWILAVNSDPTLSQRDKIQVFQRVLKTQIAPVTQDLLTKQVELLSAQL